MKHLKYYSFQTQARGVRSFADVARASRDRTHIYDRIILPWMSANKSAGIAELACGHGSFLLWLKERGFSNAIGIDSSPEQTALAQTTGVATCTTEVNAWLEQQPPNSRQAIVAIDLVEHLTKDQFVDLLEHCHRILAPMGCLILRLPNGDSPLVGLNLFNDITHVWTYTSNCLTSLSQMTHFSRAEFVDESTAAIRDHRWLKVPLSRISRAILGGLVRAAARERVNGWSPHLWASLWK